MRRPGYYGAAALALGAAYTLALTVDAQVHGPARAVAGYVGSLSLLLAIAAVAAPAAGSWRAESLALRPRAVLWVASLLLLLDVFSGKFHRFFQVHSLGPPRWAALIVIAGWAMILARIFYRGATPRRIALGLTWLVVGTRAFPLLIFPFHRLPGDMLDVIDRSLDLLLAGRFPYVNYPPPMPYLPGMFLAYLPAKLLGLDLRVTNLALEGATAWLSARPSADSRRVVDRIPVGSVLLPLLMLHPSWINLGTNTQFAPTIFTTFLLCRSLTSAGPRWQGASLGLVAGCNQMLVAVAPLALAYWLRRFGTRAAVVATLAATAVLLALLAPFLIWNAKGFLAIAFQPRPDLGREWMAGRLTLLPLAELLIPRATAMLTILAIGLGSLLAGWSRAGGEVLRAMAIALCVALLSQPVTFPHYFLPVMVLAAAATLGISVDAEAESAVTRRNLRHLPRPRTTAPHRREAVNAEVTAGPARDPGV